MTAVIADHKLRIAKAKQQAVKWMPYLNSVFGPMRCIATDQVPRAAVDKWGKMYYNPSWVMKQSIQVLAYVILHETLHIVLSHPDRSQRLVSAINILFHGFSDRRKFYIANIAQDLCIQQTLAREIEEFEPENIVRFDAMKHIPGITKNRTSEQYYEALLKFEEAERNKPKPPPIPPQDSDEEDEDEDEDEDSEDGEGVDWEDEDTDGYGDEDSEQDEDGEDAESDADGGEGGETSDEDGQSGEASETEQSNEDPEKTESDSGDGEDAGEPADGESAESGRVDDDWLPEFGEVCNPDDAGSNSDGDLKPWEEEPTLADIANNEQRLREVEKELEKLNPAIGSGAGDIRQTLQARLHPLPDPFDQLRTIVARSIASPVGSPELTYRKWPRRQLPGKCRLRGVQRYQPEATILLDTSGSMDDCDVKARALAIVAKGISRLQNPRIVCCDGAIQSAKRVASMSNFKWDGGGGTDMAKGLLYVDKTYQPDSIVIITDGYTGWPKQPLRAKVVCALCSEGAASSVPSWITTVHLYRKGVEYAL